MSRCVAPSEAVRKLTLQGTGGLARQPHGDVPGAPGPRRPHTPLLSCEADGSHR